MECPLCFSQAEFFLAGDNREYWLCSTCSLIFVPPAFFLTEKEEIQRYRQHNNSLENEGYVNMFEEKIRLIEQVCPGIKTVLDYGCGYAPVLKTLLAGKGYQAEGYDPLFFPRKNFSGKFDMVISTETFEHFKEPGKEITKIVSRLSPGGFLAIMTRFYPNQMGTVDRQTFQNWYYKRDPTHLAFYCTETMAWIAGKLGMEILLNNEKDFIIMQ